MQTDDKLDTIEAVAVACLEHLGHEDELLGSTREQLEKLHQAILAGEPKTLAQALHAQEATARALFAVRQKREQLRERAGVLLRVAPGEVTLSRLAAVAPPLLGQQLLDRRAPLRSRAAEVDRLTHAIALVSHSFLGFLQRLFVDLTGNRDCSGRYGPGGVRREPACGSILQAQG